MKTISETLKEYLKENGTIVNYGKFTGHDFIDLQCVLDGTLDNFVIYDNGGGKVFSIKTYHDGWGSLEKFEKNAINDKPYTFMYRINGKETIVKQLPTPYRAY